MKMDRWIVKIPNVEEMSVENLFQKLLELMEKQQHQRLIYIA